MRQHGTPLCRHSRGAGTERRDPTSIASPIPPEAQPLVDFFGGWSRRSQQNSRRDLTAGDEQRLDVCASGHLEMRRLKPVALLPPQDERARNHEGVSQSCTLAQRHIEKSVAKIGPLGSVLAAERGMVSVRRGHHKRIGSGEARYENAGIAGGDDHDLVSDTRPIEHLREFRRRQRRASAPGRDLEAIGRAVGGEDEK